MGAVALDQRRIGIDPDHFPAVGAQHIVHFLMKPETMALRRVKVENHDSGTKDFGLKAEL